MPTDNKVMNAQSEVPHMNNHRNKNRNTFRTKGIPYKLLGDACNRVLCEKRKMDAKQETDLLFAATINDNLEENTATAKIQR